MLIPELLAAGLVDDDELSRQRMLLPSGVVEPKLHVTLINTKLRRREPVVELGQPDRCRRCTLYGVHSNLFNCLAQITRTLLLCS